MYYPIPHPSEFSWQAREVVKELNNKPHLVVSIEITGPYFPHRAAEPFAQIIHPSGKVFRCWFADISEDNRKLKAYFPVEVPKAGKIEFGYGNMVMGTLLIEFDSKHVQLLDRKRLAKNVIFTKEEDIRELQRSPR